MEAKLNAKLLAHTQLSDIARNQLISIVDSSGNDSYFGNITDSKVISLAAIRQCYSHKTAIEVLETEMVKYFGEGGKEGNRLINQIIKSGHTSTLEHCSFTFTIEGVSRSLLAQLTRHRVGFGYSVQSQRYVKFSSNSRSGGFDYLTPEKITKKNENEKSESVEMTFKKAMESAQEWYDKLIELGVPQEDARAVLPNASSVNLVMSVNLRALLDFYSKRKPGKGAQNEISQLAERLKELVVEVEPWTEAFFV